MLICEARIVSIIKYFADRVEWPAITHEKVAQQYIKKVRKLANGELRDYVINIELWSEMLCNKMRGGDT